MLACHARRPLRKRRRPPFVIFAISKPQQTFHSIRREPSAENPCHCTGFSASRLPSPPWRTSLSPVTMTGNCGCGRLTGAPAFGARRGRQARRYGAGRDRPFASKGADRVGLMPCRQRRRRRSKRPARRRAASPLTRPVLGEFRLQVDIPAGMRCNSRRACAPSASVSVRAQRYIAVRSTAT